MKYIVTEHHGFEEMFIFPVTINHDCMMEALERIKTTTSDGWERIRRTPVSAGNITDDGDCYGRSVTLGIGSRRISDTQLFKAGGYGKNVVGEK